MEPSTLTSIILAVSAMSLVGLATALFMLTQAMKTGMADMAQLRQEQTEQLAAALGQLQTEHAKAQTAYLEQLTRLTGRSLADIKNVMDISQDASKRHLEATAALIADSEKRIAAASQRFMEDQVKAFTALTSSLAEVMNSQRDSLKAGLAGLQAIIQEFAAHAKQTQDAFQSSLEQAIQGQTRSLHDVISKEIQAMERIGTNLSDLKKVIQTDIEAGLPPT